MTLFYVRSAAAGTGTGASWTNAKTSLAALMTSGATTTGDTVYVAEDHAESTTPGAQVNFYANGANIICVDRTASGSPYLEADLRNTAILTYNGNAADLVLRGGGYMYGLNFIIGAGATTNSGSFQVTGAWIIEKVTWTWPAAVAPSVSGFWYNCADLSRSSTYIDCVWSFPNVSSNPFNQLANTAFRRCYWSWAYTTGVFFGTGKYDFLDCDLSGFPNLTTGGSRMFELGNNPGSNTIRNCKLSPTVKYTVNGSIPNAGDTQSYLDVVNSSVDGGVLVNERWALFGVHTSSYTVVRTGGAVFDTLPVGYKFVSGSAATTIYFFEGMPYTIYNAVVGSLITATVEGIADPGSFSALPKTNEVWIEAEYPGFSGKALGVFQTGGGKNIYSSGVAHTASTVAWDSKATARAQSTGYAAGDTLKVASNPGRLFFCTSPGTSTTTEPGGYASAVDGGSVTDGSATFKAGWRFKMRVQLGTPAPSRAGLIIVTPKLAKASATLYVDPKITLS